jgi:hypothetical protein
MRTIQSRQEFEDIIDRFLDWRRQYDRDVAEGKIKPLAEAMPEEAAA